MNENAESNLSEFHDSEQLSSVLKHTDVSAVQLSRGSFHAALFQRSIAEWTLQYINFLQGTSAAAGSAGKDRYMFLVPLKVDTECRLLGESFTESKIAVYSPGAEHADVSKGGLSEVVVTPPAGFIDNILARGESVHLTRVGATVRAVRAAEIRNLSQILQACSILPNAAMTSPGVARSVHDTLELSLLAVLQNGIDPHSSGRRPIDRPAVVAILRELLERSDHEPVYASELARLVSVSYPTLRRIFVEWFGIPPKRYLLLKRLYLARRLMMTGQCTTVTEAATFCGFWELGRFARRYSEIFGELPSATLAKNAIAAATK